MLLPRSGLGGYTIEARFALRSQDPNARVAPPGGPRGRPRTEPRALAWPPWKKDSTSTAAGSLDAGSTAMRLRTGGLSGSSETVTQAVPLPLESGGGRHRAGYAAITVSRSRPRGSVWAEHAGARNEPFQLAIKGDGACDAEARADGAEKLGCGETPRENAAGLRLRPAPGRGSAVVECRSGSSGNKPAGGRS